MENYRKGKNVEENLERDKIPIPNLPGNFLWMHVKGGSKIRNLLSFALKEFPEHRSVVWTAFGQPVGKAITCAEIMKRELGNTLYQITKLCYRLVDEYWDPLIPELDQLVVKRRLPMIHILLSSSPLDKDELGYQAPGVQLKYLSKEKQFNRNGNNKSRPKQYRKTPTKQGDMKVESRLKKEKKGSTSRNQQDSSIS